MRSRNQPGRTRGRCLRWRDLDRGTCIVSQGTPRDCKHNTGNAAGPLIQHGPSIDRPLLSPPPITVALSVFAHIAVLRRIKQVWTLECPFGVHNSPRRVRKLD
ncbi:hypothetical protein L596_028056 [Steinernema carpocapsae]|uniref:Uncharacterized protein n=1 Tax=Steinernema carpocapsae TaxID=34508 RepID=A0A4U5LXB0_STECR|nr:hypothetical protein L596_028056 [Steinernema carpocapsae]